MYMYIYVTFISRRFDVYIYIYVTFISGRFDVAFISFWFCYY